MIAAKAKVDEIRRCHKVLPATKSSAAQHSVRDDQSRDAIDSTSKTAPPVENPLQPPPTAATEIPLLSVRIEAAKVVEQEALVRPRRRAYLEADTQDKILLDHDNRARMQGRHGGGAEASISKVSVLELSHQQNAFSATNKAQLAVPGDCTIQGGIGGPGESRILHSRDLGKAAQAAQQAPRRQLQGTLAVFHDQLFPIPSESQQQSRHRDLPAMLAANIKSAGTTPYHRPFSAGVTPTVTPRQDQENLICTISASGGLTATPLQAVRSDSHSRRALSEVQGANESVPLSQNSVQNAAPSLKYPLRDITGLQNYARKFFSFLFPFFFPLFFRGLSPLTTFIITALPVEHLISNSYS
jgi:hypothetical protein